MRKRFSLATLLAAGLLASGSIGRAQELIDYLHTAVGDSVITAMQIEQAAEADDNNVREQFRDRPQELRIERMKLRQDILASMINYQMVLQDFKRLQKDRPIKIPETYIEEQIQIKIREDFADRRVDFLKYLQNHGLTLEQYRQQKRDEWVSIAMRGQFAPEPLISPLKIETYYNTHQTNFQIEDRVKFRLIVLDRPISDTEGQTKRRAEEILSQIKGGAEFAEMAKSYSDGTQRKEGGLSDWQEVSKINKALLADINKLKPGEVSGVIDSPDACFILRVEDRQPAHFTPLNDVRDEIERNLVRQERQRTMDKWYGRMRKKTFVQAFP